MNPHRPKKPASDESTSDEGKMIVYDVEDEVESNPDYVKKMRASSRQAGLLMYREGNKGVLVDQKVCEVRRITIRRDVNTKLFTHPLPDLSTPEGHSP
ncbi:hypothetical protein TNCV_3380901 [Trichonephila clavipes]|nr:hypothetical protein TNCV_3380901 [Trichonephila clavipes]